MIRRPGERHAERRRLVHRLDHLGGRVAQHEARVVAVEVQPVVAVGVDDVRPVPALDVERVGVEERRRPAVAAGHDGQRVLVQHARPRRLRQVFRKLSLDAHDTSSSTSLRATCSRCTIRCASASSIARKRSRCPGLTWPSTADVERAHRGQLRVATGGLAIDEQRDRLTVAGHLDAAERDAVGDDVVSVDVADPRPTQPRAHAVGLRQHLVVAAEKRPHALLGEPLGLGPEQHADLGLGPELGHDARARAPPGRPRRREDREPVLLAQRPPFDAAQATTQVRGPRAQDHRHVEAARDGDPRPHAGARRPELDHVAGLEVERGPQGRLGAVDRQRHVRARHRDRARRLHLQARAEHRALEPRRPVGVADEPVGHDEGDGIDRSGRRNPVAEVTGPPEVLHGRQRPGLEDADHAITGGRRAPRRRARCGRTRRGRSRGTGRDRRDAAGWARRHRDRRARSGVRPRIQ